MGWRLKNVKNIRNIINTVVVGWLLAEDNFFLQMYGDKSCLCNKQI